MTSTKTNKPTGPGCDSFDPGSLPYEVALSQILNAITSQKQSKRIKLRKALGRVISEDIESTMDVPNHTNSAMDGYAFNAEDLNDSGLASFKVIGTAYAGKPFMGKVVSGHAVKIMTGAIMPQGTDTVVMQEYVEQTAQAGNIEITKAIKAKQNVRYSGEDIKTGTVIFKQGTRIDSAALGVLASLGMPTLRVFKKPSVAFFSNGDEVKQVGQPLITGEVYDSNRHTLFAMLNKMCVKAIDLGTVGDDYEQIKAIIKHGDEIADIVITSAGASVGEADYIYDIICELGKVNLWKLAIKPGRPLAFGELSKSVFFGLPGNPVSVMTSFALCVKPAIEKLSGQHPKPPLLIKAKTLSNITKRPGRSEYQRAFVFQNESGELVIDTKRYQGSGVLTSMTQGNCFAVLALESSGHQAGDQIDVLLFSSIF